MCYLHEMHKLNCITTSCVCLSAYFTAKITSHFPMTLSRPIKKKKNLGYFNFDSHRPNITHNLYGAQNSITFIKYGHSAKGYCTTHTHTYSHIRECIQKFPDWVITKTTTIDTRWDVTQLVMAAKLTRLTQKIALQLNPVAESCTTCSSRSRRPVWKFLDTPSHTLVDITNNTTTL
jgi:hypothetical protein